MSDKIKVCFMDEDPNWRMYAHDGLGKDFDLLIVENLPKSVPEIWELICEKDIDVLLVDYRLNESGLVSYTGDAVVRDIRSHNLHFPIFMITSFEDRAVQNCNEYNIIRGKEMLNDEEKVKQLKLLIAAACNQYRDKKIRCENTIMKLSAKVDSGAALSEKEDADRFDAEIYLSELDLDSGVRASLCKTETSANLLKMVEQTAALLAKLS